jgi:hypothetical protein
MYSCWVSLNVAVPNFMVNSAAPAGPEKSANVSAAKPTAASRAIRVAFPIMMSSPEIYRFLWPSLEA